MQRTRSVLGLVVGFLLIGSAGLHSLLGWPQLAEQFGRANVPGDLVPVLAMGWHFGGVAMFTFGCIVIMLFLKALRGRAVSLRPALFIAISYIAFGIGALIATQVYQFLLYYVVPGLLLVVASWRPAKE